MTAPMVSQRKANATFNGLLLIGLGVLFFTDYWWPGIMAVIGVALATRQFLRGRPYDAMLSVIIFGGLFATTLLNWSFTFLIPVLFTLAGIYLLFTEWCVKRERPGEEGVEDLSQEVEDAEHPE